MLLSSSHRLARSFQRLSLRSTAVRCFATGDEGKEKETKKKENAATDVDLDAEDGFGVAFQDGAEGLGPSLPPLYERDPTTGRWTSETLTEVSPETTQRLQANPLATERYLLSQIPDDDLAGFADRVRRNQQALNPIGRSDATTEALSPQEFEDFAAYLEQKYGKTLSRDELPVADGEADSDADLTWLTARAQRQLYDDDADAEHMTPSDLSPTRLVNRKRARPMPRSLLHHNHVPLLWRFCTPTGQIQSRVQTRLGARDQRKVAKLIKRARALGLLPYVGQCVVENHGVLYDTKQKKPWEEELERRGLVLVRNGNKN